jgi:hypothetical protein
MTERANLGAEMTTAEPSGHPSFRDMAREEFWIVAKSFFAPVYGLFLVWKELSRSVRLADGVLVRDPDAVAEAHLLTPAE